MNCIKTGKNIGIENHSANFDSQNGNNKWRVTYFKSIKTNNTWNLIGYQKSYDSFPGMLFELGCNTECCSTNALKI